MSRRYTLSGIAVLAVVLSAAVLQIAQAAMATASEHSAWPHSISAAEFFGRATSGNSVVVDIRHLTEKPRQLALSPLSVVRLPWPGEVDHPRTPLQISAFFKQLKTLRRQHPERQLVLLCGVGERSADVMKRAPGFGMKSGLSQITGGVEGNDEDAGLLLELSFR